MSHTYPKRIIEVDLPIARISAHARREKSIRHGHISTLHIWWARRPLAACRAVICAALWPDPADELCPQAFRDAATQQIKSFARRVFPKKINEEGHQLKATASPESLARWEAIAAGTLTLDPNEPADGFMLRQCLLDFIADFANWDNSTVPAYLETSRALTAIAHASLTDPGFTLESLGATDETQMGHGFENAGVKQHRSKAVDPCSIRVPSVADISHLPRPLVVDPFAGGARFRWRRCGSEPMRLPAI